MSESWRRILWVNWIAQILAQMGFSIVYPFLPLYVQDLGVHNQHAALFWSGVLYAGTTVTMAVFAPIWGSFSDRYGRKLMVVRAMGCGGILILLMIFVRNPEELLVLRILQGALAGSVAASQALVASAVPRERLGSAVIVKRKPGLAQSWWSPTRHRASAGAGGRRRPCQTCCA